LITKKIKNKKEMKFIFFFLILQVELGTLTLGLKSSDICKNTNEECTGSLSLDLVYLLQCKKAKCTGLYDFDCSESYCTQSKETCEQFIQIRDLVGLMFRTPKDRMKKFFEGIRKCPALNYTFSPNEACLVGQNCYMSEKSIKTSKFKSTEVNFLTKKIACPCRESPYTYQCPGNLYCTSNNLACDALLKSEKPKEKFQLRKCLNDNLLIQKINF